MKGVSIKGGRCAGLNFLLLVPCGLVDGHVGPHVGVMRDNQRRCRAGWLADFGKSWRVGRAVLTSQNRTENGTVQPRAKRGDGQNHNESVMAVTCKCRCHTTWSNDGIQCICCVTPPGFLHPVQTKHQS